MGIVKTDLRVTREAAKRIRFYPAPPFTATNVQDAIGQSVSFPTAVSPTIVTHAMSPYTPGLADSILLVNTSAGAITINMTTAAFRGGLDIEIKDDTGNAAANPITVTFSGAETGDGLNPYPIDSNYGSVKFGPQTGGYFVHA